jgi:hypothetical protein
MALCGPTADTATLEVNAEVRVYEQQHDDGRGYTLRACALIVHDLARRTTRRCEDVPALCGATASG